ncbi:uncharacterized protein LOC123886648 [Trifolium pratense]|uniref:uncharacterized protein LOC123886648 n=1 Tax=Trifolium pratense TaxID=57577 RepID=UPI001E693E58|nr:uncharacterized protein LOC123886648 [Trifolium pratense]
MPPKEKLKVKKNSLKKNHLKKSRVILPHMVTQVAQQMPPLGKTNEMHHSDPVLRMMPTPGFSYVAWLPEHDYQIKKIFESKGSRHLSEMYMEARNKRERPSWIGEDAWKKLDIEWKKPAYKAISQRNKKNRNSAKGGSVHTGGSITFTEHTLRMAEELGREPTVDKVFLRTDIRKKDSTWVDLRSQNTYGSF